MSFKTNDYVIVQSNLIFDGGRILEIDYKNMEYLVELDSIEQRRWYGREEIFNISEVLLQLTRKVEQLESFLKEEKK